jgi:ketosteroid isomerase-like protein
MASGNVELVRSIYAAWERGDFSSVEWADPEIEFVLADGPDPGSFRGVAGMAEAWRRRVSAFQQFRQMAEEVRELDADRVLVLAGRSGRGKISGIELEEMATKPAAHVFHVRRGKVTKLVVYLDPERAFADLGLKE